MASATWLGYGITGISQADLDLFHKIQSGDAALKADYQKKYGATWYIPWGADQDRTNALYLAALSDDARLASLANNPVPLLSPAGAYSYSLHDMNRWKSMGASAFQSWLATVGNASAANYYAQVSGYTFSIVTPVEGSTEPTPPPQVSGTPAPPPATIDPYADVPRDETGAIAGPLPPLSPPPEPSAYSPYIAAKVDPSTGQYPPLPAGEPAPTTPGGAPVQALSPGVVNTPPPLASATVSKGVGLTGLLLLLGALWLLTRRGGS
jgi:hypothetical protein